jgi:hypothetical protein
VDNRTDVFRERQSTEWIAAAGDAPSAAVDLLKAPAVAVATTGLAA